MEASVSFIDVKTVNPCRCCLTSNCIRDLTNEYYFSGQKEIYADMMKETFNLELTYLQNQSNMICDNCIVKLRQSYEFRGLILQSEAELMRQSLLMEQSVDDISTNIRPEVKMELHNEEHLSDCDDDDLSTNVQTKVKIELQNESLGNGSDFEDNLSKFDGFDSSDDEILANLKTEKQADKLNNDIRKREVQVKTIEEINSKCQSIPNENKKKSVESPKKDWQKITERRGNGPILRENTLKLIENSTLCVFQRNKSRYRCFCCKEPVSDINTLREHTKKHTLKDIEKTIVTQQNRLVKAEISILKCKLCDLSIADLYDLRRHLAAEHGITLKLINEHLLVPFKLGPELKCQLCSESFTVFRHLNIHMNKHYLKNVCDVCGAGFSNLVFLNLHKTRSHKSFKCNECDIDFIRLLHKNRHDIVVHGLRVERKPRFPCPYCKSRFSQESLRVKHLNDKHNISQPYHKCNLCPKEFLTKSLKNNHIKSVHKKEKNKECDICHSKFYHTSDVIRHKATHTGEKNFKCSLCNNLFVTKHTLSRHLKRIHANNYV